MKVVIFAAVLSAIVFAVSACGGSGHPAAGKPSLHALPRSLRAEVRSLIAGARRTRGTVKSVAVYGPGTHAALEQAAAADIVNDPEQKKDFYLLVLHGHFPGAYNPSPIGAPMPPPGKVETVVWSQQARRDTDDGIGDTVPPAVAKLHEIASITVSRGSSQ